MSTNFKVKVVNSGHFSSVFKKMLNFIYECTDLAFFFSTFYVLKCTHSVVFKIILFQFWIPKYYFKQKATTDQQKLNLILRLKPCFIARFLCLLVCLFFSALFFQYVCREKICFFPQGGRSN